VSSPSEELLRDVTESLVEKMLGAEWKASSQPAI
jgi:hypothetical protein